MATKYPLQLRRFFFLGTDRPGWFLKEKLGHDVLAQGVKTPNILKWHDGGT